MFMLNNIEKLTRWTVLVAFKYNKWLLALERVFKKVNGIGANKRVKV